MLTAALQDCAHGPGGCCLWVFFRVKLYRCSSFEFFASFGCIKSSTDTVTCKHIISLSFWGGRMSDCWPSYCLIGPGQFHMVKASPWKVRKKTTKNLEASKYLAQSESTHPEVKPEENPEPSFIMNFEKPLLCGCVRVCDFVCVGVRTHWQQAFMPGNSRLSKHASEQLSCARRLAPYGTAGLAAHERA